jgi:general secretion pathway protein G
MKMQKRLNISGSGGFTLVELLVVMVIIGLLATLVVPGIIGRLRPAQHKAAVAQVATIEQALDTFRLDTGRYPTTQEGLNALITDPGVENWNGPYAKKSILTDPWQKPYQYESPGQHGDYDLFSYGADGQPGGEKDNKDITSWE